MFQKFILIAFFFLFKAAFAQDSTAIYYDQDWKETTKDKASYYRPMPLQEVGELVLIHDFYLNGTPQFEGYTVMNNERAYVGDIIWYDELGNDTTFRQYYNYTKNSTLTYYHSNGKIRKTVQYKNGVKDGETIIYGTNGEQLMKGIYINGKPTSGDFEIILEDYEGHSSEEPKMQITKIPAPVSSPSGESRKATKNNNKTITQKSFG